MSQLSKPKLVIKLFGSPIMLGDKMVVSFHFFAQPLYLAVWENLELPHFAISQSWQSFKKQPTSRVKAELSQYEETFMELIEHISPHTGSVTYFRGDSIEMRMMNYREFDIINFLAGVKYMDIIFLGYPARNLAA